MTELAPSRAPVSVAGFEAQTAGVFPPADPNRRGAFLTDVIVELGLADQETVEQVLEAARRSEQTVERSLIDSGALDEEQLALAIAERNGLDHVDLDCFDVDMGAAEMISRSTALRYRAVPIAFAADGALIVAVENPFDSLGISDIEAMTRSEVRPVIATASGIRALSERLPAVEATQPSVPPEPQSHEAPAAVLPELELEALENERPEPAAAPAALPEPELELEPEPVPAPRVERSELADELRALQEAACKADALATAVGRRIEELEGADRRAEELERELATARMRIAELEQRLSRVSAAADDARGVAEKLSALCRALEEIAP